MAYNKIIRKYITSMISMISIIGIGILFGSNYDIYCPSYKSNDIDYIKTKDEYEYVLITNTKDEYVLITNTYDEYVLITNTDNEYVLITNTDDEYLQMNNIIEKVGGLDKDPYKRKISPCVVKNFCRIARNKSIDLDNITEEQFDIIYRTYTEYLVDKYDKSDKNN